MGYYNSAAYLTQTNRLIASGRDLLAAADKSAKIPDLEKAAMPAGNHAFGFSPGAASSADPEDSLRAILFDVQSANVLIAAGIATEIPQPTSSPLAQALDQIEETQPGAASPVISYLFASGSVVNSPDLVSAKKSFRTDAQFSLDRVVTDAVDIIGSVLEQLKKLDPAQVVDAIENLGKPFEQAVAVGKLLQKGVDKLKNAVQSLLNLLGGGAFEEVKKQVSEIWTKLTNGEYARDILAWLFGVEQTMSRIDTILVSGSLDRTELDSASNAFRPLTDNFGNRMSLIKGMLGAVVLITGSLALLHVVAPWLPLALAGAYAALVGATVVIGMNYAGAGGILQWAKGVREIAESLAPASAAGS